ncbi:hypothetical protein V1522DRAFT_417410 [Lipomyces starkeyi]
MFPALFLATRLVTITFVVWFRGGVPRCEAGAAPPHLKVWITDTKVSFVICKVLGMHTDFPLLSTAPRYTTVAYEAAK